MNMVIESICDVCSDKGERRFAWFFPGYQLPGPEWRHYLPDGWQYIQGVTLCSAHSFRVIIEKVGQTETPWRIEIENTPGTQAQPFSPKEW